MTADLRVPEPGSPAALIQTLLIHANANGHQSVAVRLPSHESIRRNQTPAYGPEVMVKVVYTDGTVDIVRLDRVPRLFDAGVPIAALDCPDDPLPAFFMAAAMVHAMGLRWDLVVINRQMGQAQALASTAMVDGKPLCQTMRAQVLRHANPQVRDRAQKAGAKLTREAQYQGRHHDGWDVFAGGAAAHLLGDPTKRGLDPGRPAWQFSCRTFDSYGLETIVLVSDPEFCADPMWRLADAGVAAVTFDEYGRAKPSDLSANVWHKPLESTSDDTDGNVSDHEVTPSPTYQKVQPAPDIEDWTRTMHPRPDDQRIWHDSVGEAGQALADNQMDLETALSYVWPDDGFDGAMELASRWKAAGLEAREIVVRLCRQAGWTLQQIGDVINRHHSTVADIERRGEKKLHPGP
jgi:hypothetical protein